MSVRHILLAVLPLIGCASGPGDTTLEITFDPCRRIALVPPPDATAAELASIDAAIEMWARQGITTLVRSDDPAGLTIVFEEAAAAFHGVYEDEEGVVYINRRIIDDHGRAVTIAHEVGHAMGLWHVDPAERTSLMNPANMEIEPTPLDRAALDALWGACRQGGAVQTLRSSTQKL